MQCLINNIDLNLPSLQLQPLTPLTHTFNPCSSSLICNQAPNSMCLTCTGYKLQLTTVTSASHQLHVVHIEEVYARFPKFCSTEAHAVTVMIQYLVEQITGMLLSVYKIFKDHSSAYKAMTPCGGMVQIFAVFADKIGRRENKIALIMEHRWVWFRQSAGASAKLKTTRFSSI